MNNLYKLLDRLESVIMDGIPIPLLPYSLVNQEKLITLLDKIQTVIPDEVQQAERLLTRKEEIQQETQRKAQQLLEDSKQRADQILSESELLKAVKLEAERTRQQVVSELEVLRQKTLEETEQLRRRAYEESKMVRESADRYAEHVLGTLTGNLEQFQMIAKQGKQQIKQARQEASQQQKQPQGQQQAPQKPSFFSHKKAKEASALQEQPQELVGASTEAPKL